MRIVFMGTPEFAVPGLVKLIESKKNVVAVITAPDKPSGRGLKFQTSAIKDTALKYNIPVLQPVNLKDPVFLEELRSYKADLQIVIAFRMLPELVWNMPHHGTFNLHASLLPQYRGAAPINWALINGEKETGVTTFFLQHEIDTGNIIFQEKIPIDEGDNFETLYHKLMHLGSHLVVKTVDAIENGTCPALPQKVEMSIKNAPKITKELCKIDFTKSSEEIKNLIRGLSPVPGAWTDFNGKLIKIYKAEVDSETFQANDEYLTDKKTFFKLKTGDGWLDVIELQLEGKKKMKVDEFLRGYKF